MTHLDETGTPAGDGENRGVNGNPPAADGPSRLQELERENARLRAELAEVRAKHQLDRDLLLDYMLEGMPRTEEEFHRAVREGPTFGQLLDELIPQYRPGADR
ncbi:MAG: hypothetical protein K2X87_27565 [Gemmataceae bacterium]|nr:hypothetical protein [Gemmataceae bacterium]